MNKRTQIGSILLAASMMLTMLPPTLAAETDKPATDPAVVAENSGLLRGEPFAAGKDAVSAGPAAEPSVTVTKWDELKTAIQNGEDGAVIQVQGTLKYASEIDIPAGKHITLVGDSAELERGRENFSAFHVLDGAALTLSGDWSAKEQQNSEYRFPENSVITVDAGGSFTLAGRLEGMAATNSSTSLKVPMINCHGQAFLVDGAELTGYQVTLRGGKNGTVCALAIDGPDAKLTMSGGSVRSNAVTSWSYTVGSGAIQILNGASFAMSGGSIEGNGMEKTSKVMGGGVYVSGGSHFYMTGGRITGNHAAVGGGIYAESNAVVELSGSAEVQGNFSKEHGGGIALRNATLDATGVTIQANTITWQGYGGAIFSEASQVTLNNVTIQNNQVLGAGTSATGGAGLAVTKKSVLTMTGGSIIGNRANGSPDGDGIGAKGGGLYVNSENDWDSGELLISKCELQNVTIADNEVCVKADGTIPEGGNRFDVINSCGGGIYVSGEKSEVTLTSCTVQKNKSGYQGGGISIYSRDGRVILNDTVVSWNTCATNIKDGKNDGSEFRGGDGVYVGLKGQLVLSGSTKIDPQNDVAIEYKGNPNSIGVNSDFTGSTTQTPIQVTSQDQRVELENKQGASLVSFETAELAAQAAQDKLFVTSQYMPQELRIGQSKIADHTNWLTYVPAPPAQHTVTFHSNFDVDATETRMVTPGESLALTNTFQRDGYAFNGWNTAADNTGTAYADGATLTPNGDLDLYAQWIKVHTFTFQPGDHGTLSGETTVQVQEGTTIVALPTVTAAQGFTFTGWKDENGVAMTEAEILALSAASGKTFTAQYSANSPAPSGSSSSGGLLNRAEHMAYMVGYPDGTFGPERNILRCETAAVFHHLLNQQYVPQITHLDRLKDVDPNSWYAENVAVLCELGIMYGRSSDTFAPYEPITRGEFATVCAHFDDSQIEDTCHFSDISGHWAEEDIRRAASLGWISGYPDGTFRPDQYITRSEAVALINQMLERVPERVSDMLPSQLRNWPDVPEDHWCYIGIQEATHSHEYVKRYDRHERWTSLLDRA